jgi:plasmid stability protein
MATLVVRKVEDDILAGLRERAKRHGRSMEAEVRAIIRDVVGPPVTSASIIETLQRSPLAEVDDAIWDRIAERRDAGRSFEW